MRLRARDGIIPPDFEDPYLELVRLLHGAAEVEHALMLQYLYACFSLKPDSCFVGMKGVPIVGHSALFGVAIEEMRHLHTVNELLVALGAAPNLARQDFPYEPAIYPFELSLEPLSVVTLAKYTYAEAPQAAIDSGRDRELWDMLGRALGSALRPNHVGSLYRSVLVALKGLVSGSPPVPLRDPARWQARIAEVRDDGEGHHFTFFRTLLLSTDGPGGANPWLEHPAGDTYPAEPLPANPTAYRGHPNEIKDPVARDLAWLGDLHYWIVLALLDLHYRYGDRADLQLAQRHMRRPLYQLGMHLASLGVGLPFDPPTFGASVGRDEAGTRAVVAQIVSEARSCALGVGGDLPQGFELGIYRDSLPPDRRAGF